MSLPFGWFGDWLGYSTSMQNGHSAESLTALNNAYGHLFNFENMAQINDYYANREPMSFGDFSSALGTGLDQIVDQAAAGLTDFTGLDFNSLVPEGGLFSPSLQPYNPNSASGAGSGAIAPSTNDFLNAELAAYYGMDRNTAYQEALANTAYQRAVIDMQRAGLNPAAIFGAGRGATASGVGYVGSNSASGFGSGSGSGKLFSNDDFGLIASLSGLVTAIATKNPSNFWLGQQGASALMTTLNGLDSKLNK